jgi:hypothetical protein
MACGRSRRRVGSAMRQLRHLKDLNQTMLFVFGL